MSYSDRDMDRRLVAPGAILSVSRAAQLLPIQDTRGRQWLRERGLVRDLDGRPVVLWRDVLEALGDPPVVAVPTPAPNSMPS